MISTQMLAALTLAGVALPLGACSDDASAANEQVSNAAAPTPGDRLAHAWNGSWITLSGRVVESGPNRFQLDYGNGRVTVEMDDWDWFHEGRELVAGDQVTVTGRIDKDLAEQKTIEASSVYVKNLGSVFYANPHDEEDLVGTTVLVPGQPGWVVATGNVAGIEGREFSLGSGGATVRVDTAKMAENPLDSEGRFQVKPGDRVQVWGNYNAGPREDAEIMADGLAILTPDKTKTQSASTQ
ncbi:NirD/YgiW/YdeI family stress tolerance protein [Sphingomonas parva]|uniref:NirD/YgiW/YdeI family stress tolerance protein n=1 Tax=Sphingomonas parva TaxID=2555898 RepID=A0A4Y8ZNE8_9SPHN|nr:NirD/YgiW/YdeI family stress tolerance protein [Sphingomonas parva]TFI57528.1 NirD/YgiW/YdeI family stress tolerance protein [Sphingomonas parva]